MTKRARPQRQSAKGPSGPSRTIASRPKRWPLAVAIAVSVTVGLVWLERWFRPIERPGQGRGVLHAPPSRSATKPPILPDPVTDQELIARTKQVGDRLAQDFPDDPAAITLAGHICWTLDEPAKAVASWEQCTQTHPEYAEAWNALGMDAFKKGDFEKAAERFLKSYGLSPQMADGNLSMMIDSLVNAGRPQDVVAVLEPLRRARSPSAHAAVVLGQAYLQLKQYDKAKRELLEAVAIDPRLATAHFALAQAMLRLGDDPGAQKHREEYAKLKSAEIATSDLRRVDRLKSDLVETRPLAARFLAWTAEIYASHARADEAEQLWGASLAVDPKNAEARKRLERLYRTQGRLAEANEIARAGDREQAPIRKP